MPALIAACFNPDLKAKYQQMLTGGKPAKIAITAIMRKLIVTANALLKADRCWQQSRLSSRILQRFQPTKIALTRRALHLFRRPPCQRHQPFKDRM